MKRTAGYIDSSSGQLFYLMTLPGHEPVQHSGDVTLIVPPFAEELNRSRKMLSDLGMHLASRGGSCIVPDLFGTGDSAGNFCEADIPVWLGNIVEVKNQLLDQGFERIHLVGLRAGCLLISALKRADFSSIASVGFLQPELKGTAVVRNLLRQKLSANWVSGTPKVTHKELRAQLERDKSLEISGYEMSHALVSSLEKIAVDKIRLPGGVALKCIELAKDPEAPPATALQSAIEAIGNSGTDVHCTRVHSAPFWAMTEASFDEGFYQQIVDDLSLGKN